MQPDINQQLKEQLIDQFHAVTELDMDLKTVDMEPTTAKVITKAATPKTTTSTKKATTTTTTITKTKESEQTKDKVTASITQVSNKIVAKVAPKQTIQSKPIEAKPKTTTTTPKPVEKQATNGVTTQKRKEQPVSSKVQEANKKPKTTSDAVVATTKTNTANLQKPNAINNKTTRFLSEDDEEEESDFEPEGEEEEEDEEAIDEDEVNLSDTEEKEAKEEVEEGEGSDEDMQCEEDEEDPNAISLLDLPLGEEENEDDSLGVEDEEEVEDDDEEPAFPTKEEYKENIVSPIRKKKGEFIRGVFESYFTVIAPSSLRSTYLDYVEACAMSMESAEIPPNQNDDRQLLNLVNYVEDEGNRLVRRVKLTNTDFEAFQLIMRHIHLGISLDIKPYISKKKSHDGIIREDEDDEGNEEEEKEGEEESSGDTVVCSLTERAISKEKACKIRIRVDPRKTQNIKVDKTYTDFVVGKDSIDLIKSLFVLVHLRELVKAYFLRWYSKSKTLKNVTSISTIIHELKTRAGTNQHPLNFMGKLFLDSLTYITDYLFNIDNEESNDTDDPELDSNNGEGEDNEDVENEEQGVEANDDNLIDNDDE